ncbi:DUF6801 domain-containing protein [Streptomyces sp. GZWMJZ-114]|uniref:DUF6801 domain-containing protein n=1 Tax=Streptomyces sp. GZWMJZ-114 TaxID=2494734 RepID=UPI001011FF64|nr:DUF6801 domain-containing protein [Streptomyces sp. GZWMJZ-114]
MRATGRGAGARRAARPARVAAATATALMLGLLTGTGSQADEDSPTTADLAYACRFPDSTGAPATTVDARVEVTTRLPGSAVPGSPIDAGTVEVAAHLPRAATSALFPDAHEVSGSAALGVDVRQNKDRARADWSLVTAGTELPAQGAELVLPSSGKVPTITVNSAGRVLLLGGEARFVLQPDVGAPVSLACSPAPGREPRVAEIAVPEDVAVPEDTRPASPGGDHSSGPAAREEAREDDVTLSPQEDEPAVSWPDECDDMPTGELDTSVSAPPPPYHFNPIPLDGVPMCAYAVGISTVRKQNGSMLINDPSGKPALMRVRGVVRSDLGDWGAEPGSEGFNQIWSLAEIHLPDARASFLSFGYLPVTASVTFETGKVTILTGQPHMNDPTSAFARIVFQQSLRLHDVVVNGTPLDVGPSCRTAKSFRVLLNGDMNSKENPYVNVFSGGLLTGKVTIPAFTGCGAAGENLNGLFTAAISGPDNELRMNQAPTCVTGDFPSGCPPVVPELPRLRPTSS